MVRLIIVRHGLSGTDGHLSKHGRAQIRFCAQRIGQICAQMETILIRSSIEPCAMESAAVINNELTNAQVGSLSPEFNHQKELSQALEWLKSEEVQHCDVAIIVTHSDTSEELLSHYCCLYGIGGKPDKLQNGEACVIETRESKCFYIRF